MKKSFTELCPEYEEQTTITVEYQYIETLSEAMQGNTLKRFRCSLAFLIGYSVKNCPIKEALFKEG